MWFVVSIYFVFYIAVFCLLWAWLGVVPAALIMGVFALLKSMS